VGLWRTLVRDDPPPAGIQIHRIQSRRGRPGLAAEGIDYKTWKLFLLSILWRAGVVSRSEYRGVLLGPYELKLRKMLLDGDPGRRREFPVILWRLSESFPGVSLIHPVRDLEGRQAYVTLLSRLRVAYYVSGHVNDEIARLTISENGTMQVAEIALEELPERAELQAIAHEIGSLPESFL